MGECGGYDWRGVVFFVFYGVVDRFFVIFAVVKFVIMIGGKGKCMILKSIRKAVADVIGICYVPHECTFQGECSGTCPACEAEVRYLERELKLRRLAGRAVTVAGIALGAVALTACGNDVMTHLGQEQTAVKADGADKVFGMVEEQPSFPGGQAALMKYIEENMRCPDPESDASGRVIVQFVIGKDGTVKDPKVVRGITPALDEEALRLVRNMPKWRPGKQMGKAVEVRYTMPVTFKWK